MSFSFSGEASAVGMHTNRVPHLKVKLVKRFSAGLKKFIDQLIKCNCSGLYTGIASKDALVSWPQSSTYVTAMRNDRPSLTPTGSFSACEEALSHKKRR